MCNLVGYNEGPQQQKSETFPVCRVLLCGKDDQGQQLAARLLLSLAGSLATVIGLPQILGETKSAFILCLICFIVPLPDPIPLVTAQRLLAEHIPLLMGICAHFM